MYKSTRLLSNCDDDDDVFRLTDTALESERLRCAQLHTEQLLDIRERANRQRVKGLEQQVNNVVFLLLT